MYKDSIVVIAENKVIKVSNYLSKIVNNSKMPIEELFKIGSGYIFKIETLNGLKEVDTKIVGRAFDEQNNVLYLNVIGKR